MFEYALWWAIRSVKEYLLTRHKINLVNVTEFMGNILIVNGL